MSILQTIAVFVVAPAVLYGLIALFTVVPGRHRRPKYRPGESWDYPAQWWAGDIPVAAPGVVGTGERRGGARGTW